MKIKKRNTSKKKKNVWRKHIDESDVNAFLEEERFNERCGKPVEQKSNAELFSIDTKPKTLIRDSILCPRPKNIDDLNLKCFQGLENSSAVRDPLIKRNTVRTKEQRQHPALRKKNELRLEKGILKKKELSQLQRFFRKRISSFEQKSRRRITVDKDLWQDAEISEGSKLSKTKNWINETTYLHTVRNTSDLTNKSKYRPDASKTVVTSFETPHPGTSYNPTFQDHLNLANSVANKEMEIVKEEAHLTRVTQKLFKQITTTENEETWMKEMSEGLPLETVVETSESIEESDGEYKAINPPVSRENKKTIKQKKRELSLKKEELKVKEIEEQKKKSMDIDRLEKINQEILREELKKTKRSLKRALLTQEKLKTAGRVCKNKYVPEEPPISDIQELTGSLREILPQGNILRDTLSNMQKRSIIEITKPQFKTKKRKMKKYRLGSHHLDRKELEMLASKD